MLLEHALGSAAGVHADLGKAQASEAGCESAGSALRLPRKPALVLAFSSCVDLGKLLQFSEPQVSTEMKGYFAFSYITDSRLSQHGFFKIISGPTSSKKSSLTPSRLDQNTSEKQDSALIPGKQE